MYKKKSRTSRLIKAYIFSIVICVCLLLILFLVDSRPEIVNNVNESNKEIPAENEPVIENMKEDRGENDLVSSVKLKKLYFVIDDTGYNLKQLEAFLNFPVSNL